MKSTWLAASGVGAAVGVVCVLGAALHYGRSGAAEAAKKPRPAGRIEQKPGESLTMHLGRTVLWRLNFSKAEGKPYFHPVCLPDGTLVTWHRPPDHRWHRALWFSWKYINKLNYWEENKQGFSQGRTVAGDVECRRADDGAATLTMSLDYHPPAKPVLLKERRTIRITMPDAGGAYRMDWDMTFAAQEQDVLLDRTPIPGEKGGKGWGGYAGLSYRAAEAMTEYRVLDSEGRTGTRGHGKHARWADFSGLIDPKTKKAAGVAMFDHPTNLRHPTCWFVIARGKFGYLSPALLFEKPYALAAGKTLRLRYRVLIHPGRGEKGTLDKEYGAFAATKPAKGQ